MLIRIISIDNYEVVGSHKVLTNSKSQEIYIFSSPIHWAADSNANIPSFNTVTELANYFKNDCLL